MSSNPSSSGSGYQIGVGAPVNQQYLNPAASKPRTSSSPQQQQSYHPLPSTDQPHDQQYVPPPPYTPGAPDILTPEEGQHMMSGGSGPAPANQQLYPQPTPHHAIQSPQPQLQGQSQEQQMYYPPPPQQTNQTSQPPGMHAPASHQPHGSSGSALQQTYPPSLQHAPDGYHDSVPPPQPPRPTSYSPSQSLTATQSHAAGNYPMPPRRHSAQFLDDDPSSPIHYSRDPHKLVAYLVPFPKPQIKEIAPSSIPDRFLIYTPPPPPLTAPKEGEKEDKFHKVQRKWQEEVRAAKTSDAKTASWKGVKSKATKGISYVMSKTTTSNLDFVNRIPGPKSDTKDHHADDGIHEETTTHKTVGLEEMVLVYPSSYNASPDQVRVEFISTMMRTKSKAQRDAVLATGLLPISAAIDIMATLIWPFGGLLEIDGVWAYSSIRGAKTARSVTKRLSSSTHSNDPTTQHPSSQSTSEETLRLNFTQSPRLEILYRYLSTRCRDIDATVFPTTEVAPTETEVLAAIGWAPSQTGGMGKNWEDEEWETQEVKDDMRMTLGKAAKEWDKWCKAFGKDAEKALKK